MTKIKWGVSSFHRKSYGEWAGNPKGRKPDPDCCAEKVYHDHSRMFMQCSRKRGHGPEKAFCKQHSPEAKAARAAKAQAKFDVQRARWRKQALDRELRDKALELVNQIAVGHNDPRGAAIELLESHNATPTQHETATSAENTNETDS